MRRERFFLGHDSGDDRSLGRCRFGNNRHRLRRGLSHRRFRNRLDNRRRFRGLPNGRRLDRRRRGFFYHRFFRGLRSRLGFFGRPEFRLDATQLERLADISEADGDGTLSMTPWQGVFVHGVLHERAPAVLDALASLGLVCAPTDPLASLVACTGSAGCAKSRADTKRDALALAARIGRPLDVHLTGCARHCALPHAATHTLVAVVPGRYDLYRRDAAAGLGAPLARHLTIDQAAARLTGARHSQDTTDA